MILGRSRELRYLEELYAQDHFELVALYGRYRIGKSALIKEFLRAHAQNALYLGALDIGDRLNLARFSSQVLKRYPKEDLQCFESWELLFSYLSELSLTQKLIVIIDEYTALTERCKKLGAMLCSALAHGLARREIMLVLLGSNMRLMERDVLGKDSLLHSYVTASFELKAFDCFDSIRFFPHYDVEDKLCAYAMLGGIPGYLSQFDPMLSLKDNLLRYVVHGGSSLREEPQLLLKYDLRELPVYNAILKAVADGAQRLQEISCAIQEPSTATFKYLTTLIDLGMIKRELPCGEKSGSRRGRYVIGDCFTAFWYGFIFGEAGVTAFADEEQLAQEILGSAKFAHFMEQVFARICREFLTRKACRGELPFNPSFIGRWWGNDPKGAEQTTVEILLMDSTRKRALLAASKYKYEPFGRNELEMLFEQGKLFPRISELYFCVFSRSGFTEQVKQISRSRQDLVLYDLFELFTPVWAHRGI